MFLFHSASADTVNVSFKLWASPDSGTRGVKALTSLQEKLLWCFTKKCILALTTPKTDHIVRASIKQD